MLQRRQKSRLVSMHCQIIRSDEFLVGQCIVLKLDFIRVNLADLKAQGAQGIVKVLKEKARLHVRPTVLKLDGRYSSRLSARALQHPRRRSSRGQWHSVLSNRWLRHSRRRVAPVL